jgi:predicted small secreted protein
MISLSMRTFAIVTLLVAPLALPSCNTSIGVCRDIRALGEGMENVAYGRTWDGQEQRPKSSQESQPSSHGPHGPKSQPTY